MAQDRIRFTEESLTEEGFNNCAAKLLSPGTILVSIFATIGRTAVLDVPAATNQAIVGVFPKNVEQLSPAFLRHFLDSCVEQLSLRARGVAQVNINSGVLRSLEVPVPEVGEQRRIAAVLDQAEALRSQRRRALALLERMAVSSLDTMLLDRDSKKWPVVAMGEIAQVQGGLQVTAARKSLPLELPYLRVANVFRGRLDLSEIKEIRVSAAEAARTALAKNDLLIVEGHGNPAEIGRAALWTGEISPCVHQNHIIRARLDAERAVAAYACAYLNSVEGRRHLLRSGKTTSGLNTISVSNVRDTPVLLPPLEQQRSFASAVANIAELSKVHSSALANLGSLFASLQHRAFSGQL